MQTQVLHLRLEVNSYKALQRVAGPCGLSANALATILLKAGIEAIAKNADKVPLPLEFEVRDTQSPDNLKAVKLSARR